MEQTPIRIYWPQGGTANYSGRTSRGDLIKDALRAYAETFLAPTTTITMAWMTKTVALHDSIYLGMMKDMYLVADILDAERDGFDAAMIGPHWDPGLYAAREAAGIPVSGPAESAMMVAQTLGGRFAILTPNQGLVPVIERLIRLYGYESRAIAHRPVRAFTMVVDELIDAIEQKSDAFLQAFAAVARGCIEDGADVVIGGGQLFGPAFANNRFFTIPNTGVPVVDVSACGLKMAESLAALRRSIGLAKSEHRNAPFRTPAREEVARSLAEFGIR